MLQMLPQVSEARASGLATKYSCPKKLLQSTKNPLLSLLEQQLQYQHDFLSSKEISEKKKVKAQKSLSKLLFKMITSVNKDELLDGTT